MIYKILYNTNDSKSAQLFEIDYYIKQITANSYCLEIDCLPLVKGLTLFLKDKFNKDDFDYQSFIEDSYEIEEIRGTLYETRNNGLKI